MANGETSPEKIKFTGEIPNLWPFVSWLREQYGDLTENFTLDAGLWSREMFARFDEEELGIFGQLKGNKPELRNEAERVLHTAQKQRTPDAESMWEPNKGGKIRRELWRVTNMDGWNGWHHLRQLLLVKQTTRWPNDRPDDAEFRYFATNLPKSRMTPRELLLLVRRHWAIENDCNWSFDMVFGEDDGTWCTQGKAVLALGVLRMIAYNLLQWLRKSHVQVQHKRVAQTPRPWREVHEFILVAWVRIGVHLLQRLKPMSSA